MDAHTGSPVLGRAHSVYGRILCRVPVFDNTIGRATDEFSQTTTLHVDFNDWLFVFAPGPYQSFHSVDALVVYSYSTVGEPGADVVALDLVRCN
jgi:hypothetical protein